MGIETLQEIEGILRREQSGRSKAITADLIGLVLLLMTWLKDDCSDGHSSQVLWSALQEEEGPATVALKLGVG